MLTRLGGAGGALEIARRNAARAKPARHKEAPLAPEQLTLPFWPDGERALPNEILRSALFAARNRNQPRLYLRGAQIAAIGDVTVTYTGEELRQDDATVVFHLVHLVRQHGANKVRFSTRAFCQALGWAPDGRSYSRLRAILTRLQATALVVRSARLGAGVSLSILPNFKWQANGEAQEVSLDPVMVRLFADNHFSRIEWAQRLALPDGLATWLHGFFASHREPHPVRLEAIREAAGLQMTERHHLRQKVEGALVRLEAVGFLSVWSIRGEFVHVTRTP